jgi:hypothetical protein
MSEIIEQVILGRKINPRVSEEGMEDFRRAKGRDGMWVFKKENDRALCNGAVSILLQRAGI